MLKKAILVSALVVTIIAIRPRTASGVAPAPQFGPPHSQQSPQEREMEDRRQREANKKRQEEIRDDTQKLFQLATELKDAVDKSNEHELSLMVIKKAEEVEKLAKKVKEKMREGVGRPATEPQPTPSGHPPGL